VATKRPGHRRGFDPEPLHLPVVFPKKGPHSRCLGLLLLGVLGPRIPCLGGKNAKNGHVAVLGGCWLQYRGPRVALVSMDV
jgi:hypothetical protein